MRQLSWVILILMILTIQLHSFDEAKKNETRQLRYNFLSKYLEALSSDEISTLLQKTPQSNINEQKTLTIDIEGTPVFVKKILFHIHDEMIEMVPSTKKILPVPFSNSYGIGSLGLEVGREISSHQMINDWILTGECENFPLMYHWRVIRTPLQNYPQIEDQYKNHIQCLDHSIAIEKLFQPNQPQTYVVLFLEYFPKTVDDLLTKEILKQTGNIDKTFQMIENETQKIASFLNSKGMLHFDAHLKNILTDDNRLYFTDFGLTMSSQFILSEEEVQFFYHHQNYDRCYLLMTMTSWIIWNFFDHDDFDQILKEYASGNISIKQPERLTAYLSSFLKRNAPIAYKMSQFFKTLRENGMKAVYPSEELDKLWIKASSASF